jgi:hypothetical protein
MQRLYAESRGIRGGDFRETLVNPGCPGSIIVRSGAVCVMITAVAKGGVHIMDFI